jgi:hypothetical protein
MTKCFGSLHRLKTNEELTVDPGRGRRPHEPGESKANETRRQRIVLIMTASSMIFIDGEAAECLLDGRSKSSSPVVDRTQDSE